MMDKTRLMTDEMNWSLAWMNANLTGLPGNRVYVYPGSYEDTSTEAIAVAAGYAGSRGSGTMQPSPNAATVLGSGYNVQNILSQGMVPYFQGSDGPAIREPVSRDGVQVGGVGSADGNFLALERTDAVSGGADD